MSAADFFRPVFFKKTITAALIAPVFAPLLFAAIATVRDPEWILQGRAAMVLGIVLLLGYAGVVFFGLPVALGLLRFKRLSPASLGLAGFIGGMLVQYAFYANYGLMGVALNFSYTEFLYGGAHGCLVAVVFGLIATRGQSGRS